MINNREKVDVLIVTVADNEDVAVRNIIAETWNEIPRLSKSDLWVDMVRVKSKKGNSFSIGLVRVPSMGTDGTGDAVATLIQQLTPTCIAMCGICAGHPDDTELGDVIIVRDVFRYDSKSVKRIDSNLCKNRCPQILRTLLNKLKKKKLLKQQP
jgi:nucleoside phosphorylase